MALLRLSGKSLLTSHSLQQKTAVCLRKWKQGTQHLSEWRHEKSSSIQMIILNLEALNGEPMWNIKSPCSYMIQHVTNKYRQYERKIILETWWFENLLFLCNCPRRCPYFVQEMYWTNQSWVTEVSNPWYVVGGFPWCFETPRAP